MRALRLTHPSKKVNAKLTISGSKSESNRLLILQALYGGLEIANRSQAKDTELLCKALKSDAREIDIGHAGTAMRFLTAYFAIQLGRETLLTGSDRMKQRPIGILVDALQALGADIRYAERTGYPPLLIRGRALSGGRLRLSAGVSSQYVSALLLIAPKLARGLSLELQGTVTSKPYIDMTLELLLQLDITAGWDGTSITVLPRREALAKSIVVESDWSAASYHYAVAALAREASLQLKTFKPQSLQGDSELRAVYERFGVRSHFECAQLVLRKAEDRLPPFVALNLMATPDIAQTLAVSCFGLGLGCRLSGLHTLRIKETDRLQALQDELRKLGAPITVTDDTLYLENSKGIRPEVRIKTYDDHRMAMAFAPLALKVPITIEAPEVVEKSYPNFWGDLERLGFEMQSL